MISARYKNGMHYTCHDWSKLDLAAMKLDGLDDLQVGPFRLHFIAHGTPKLHFLRRGAKTTVKAIAEAEKDKAIPHKEIYCYILETELWKIFVFDNGGMAILKEWDPTSAWFHAPEPLTKKENGNEKGAKLKS